jgi:D-psicose/D-tagatose/L-ribulose 3-epimerase
MNRIGLNTFINSSNFTDADLGLIERYNSFGFDVIELAIIDPQALNVSKLKAALANSEMEQPILCGAFCNGRDLRGITQEVETSVAYIHQLIDLAIELNSQLICGPMYSETGRANHYSPEKRTNQLDQIAEALKPLCERAQAAGIVLALEPLNRFETDCINTLEQATHFIDRVGSDALKIHIDTFHMHIEESNSAAAIRQAAGYIGHVHASASHRGILGQDQIDWQGVIGALKFIDYQGDIVVEGFSSNNQTIARAASIWRPLFSSPEQFAKECLGFLREQMDLNRPKVELSGQ